MFSAEGSRRLVADACRVIPGGVNSHFRSDVRPTPLVFRQGQGAVLTDVDGNELIDYFLGMGPMLLGHSPQLVIEAVKEQVERGILYAGQSQVEYEAARLVVEMVPCAERVRFCSSGSEAVHAALRVARAATGRRHVVKFEGHYHGWLDGIYWSVAPSLERAGPPGDPRLVPGSAGQSDADADGLVVLPWNDLPALTDRLRSVDCAAVIMEPVMFNTAGAMPQPGFLEGARAACAATGTLLVFDEVITGFRVAAGGAQEHFGVTPDLAVLGKALANGFPVAAVVGRADVMDLFAPQAGVVHGGTYNAQPVAMAATVATLVALADPSVRSRIDEAGSALMAGLGKVFADHQVPAQISGFPAVFQVRFGDRVPVDYRAFLACDRQGYADFAVSLLDQGVRALARGTWFVSAAHEPAHVERTLEAVDETLRRRDGARERVRDAALAASSRTADMGAGARRPA